jgi:hypothetical protein
MRRKGCRVREIRAAGSAIQQRLLRRKVVVPRPVDTGVRAAVYVSLSVAGRKVVAMTDAGDIEQFLEESFERPVVRLEKDDLRAFIELARTEGVRIVDWHTRGIPAPDVLQGMLQVRPEAIDQVFATLRGMRKWLWHDYFPIGIPKPDEFLVRFSNVQEMTD